MTEQRLQLRGKARAIDLLEIPLGHNQLEKGVSSLCSCADAHPQGGSEHQESDRRSVLARAKVQRNARLTRAGAASARA